MGQDASDIRRKIEVTRGELGETVDALVYQADLKARMKDAVDNRVSAAKKSMSNAAENAHERVGRALDNPLGRVGGAFAIGMLAGLMLPVSEVEHRRIGPLKGRLVERGRQAVAEKARSVMHTAQTVITAKHKS